MEKNVNLVEAFDYFRLDMPVDDVITYLANLTSTDIATVENYLFVEHWKETKAIFKHTYF